jgi:DNA-directed RNA polymerase subunit N (RpoN/RPB10)
VPALLSNTLRQKDKKMTDLPLVLHVHHYSKTRKGSVMVHIVAGILSLVQYLQSFGEVPSQLRLERCLCCGRANPRLHGHYPRKTDRSWKPGESLNPILIQRYFCPGCLRTCSVLPECIPPRRWYLWEVQQIALLLLLAGKSAYAAAKEIVPSRYTISRWTTELTEQFHLHKDVLCGHFIDLGRNISLSGFWQACLNKMPLSQAMRLCHVAGVPVP